MKIALITGASSGIGREFVKIMIRERKDIDQIWVVARRIDRLNELKQELGDKIIPIPLDLSDSSKLQLLQDRLESCHADVRMLVNCAGYAKFGQFENLSYESQMGMIEVNCMALTATTYMVLPYMRVESKIINIASSAAFFPQSKLAVYGASKAYVLSFSRALNMELKKKKISVIAVCPGPVKTEFFEVAETENKIGFISKLKRADAEKVANKAYKDAMKKKEVSVYGASMKVVQILTKTLPHKLFLRILG